jgi:glycosyltransferase involved in cell wall biosynthesis
VSIINTHSSRDSWIGSIAGRLTGTKVLRTRHISSDLKKDVLTKLVYGPLSDAIITTGEFIRGQLINELGIDAEKVRSIPTGVDIGKYSSADGKKVRAELGFGPDDIVLGTAAALRSWKGHEFLIKAMPMLLKDYPQIKMVFAGEGRRRRRMKVWIDELGISKNVFLLGHREDVADVISSFDISLLASYASEGIPQFVLQSMAAGKPVIGTTIGGIPEVVRDGVNGLIVPPMDPEAIAAAVKKIISTNGMKEKMGEAGRTMAQEKHSTEHMLDDLELLYGKLLYNNEF